MLKFFFIIPLVILSVNVKAIAQNKELNKRVAVASFVSELSECAIFYSILGQATDNSGKQWQGGKKFQKLSEKISMMSFNLAKEINMKPETVLAMMTDFSKKMGHEIDHDAINIRILTNKHGKFCKKIAENPQERLIFWLSQEK